MGSRQYCRFRWWSREGYDVKSNFWLRRPRFGSDITVVGAKVQVHGQSAYICFWTKGIHAVYFLLPSWYSSLSPHIFNLFLTRGFRNRALRWGCLTSWSNRFTSITLSSQRTALMHQIDSNASERHRIRHFRVPLIPPLEFGRTKASDLPGRRWLMGIWFLVTQCSLLNVESMPRYQATPSRFSLGLTTNHN